MSERETGGLPKEGAVFSRLGVFKDFFSLFFNFLVGVFKDSGRNEGLRLGIDKRFSTQRTRDLYSESIRGMRETGVVVFKYSERGVKG